MASKNKAVSAVPPGTIPGKTNTMTIAPGGVPQPGLGTGVPTGAPIGSSAQKTLAICPYLCQTVKLDNVFPPVSVAFNGTVLWAFASTGPGVSVNISFEQPSNPTIPFYAPAKIAGFPFTQIWISNSVAQAGQTITLFAALDKNDTTLEIDVG